MSTCWTCAKVYDPKVTCSPMHYCSSDCYDFGSRPYSKQKLTYDNRQDKIKDFAINLIDKLHYLSHNNDDRFDCDWDLCVEAKILGL